MKPIPSGALPSLLAPAPLVSLLAPTRVRGAGAKPVFKALAREAGEPTWNFDHYVVSADGSTVRHFGIGDRPDSAALTAAIEEVL